MGKKRIMKSDKTRSRITKSCTTRKKNNLKDLKIEPQKIVFKTESQKL